MRTWLSLRQAARIAGVTTLASLSLACLASVEGDRASTGECPPGEVCSDETPSGLEFVGRSFFDTPTPVLGPVLVGGTFELGIRALSDDALPAFSASSEGGVFHVRRGDGVFGPVSGGEPLYPVDAHLVLRATRPGFSYVRVADPDTGALYDRLELEAVELQDVEVVVAREPERPHLYAGCEEMVGVRFLADNGTTEVRAFDQDMQVRVDGEVLPGEPLFWDCVLHDVPADATEVTFEVDVVGETFRQSFPVRSLADDDLTECPDVVVD